MKLRSLDVARSGLIAVAVLAVAALAACGREQAPPPPPPPAAADAEIEKILVRSPADDTVMVTLRLTANDVTILFDENGTQRVLRGRRDGEAKERRYHERGGEPVAVTRPNPEAGTLTVRRPGGDLRWRVRFGKNRVLMEDNPEVAAFELRQPNPETVRVRFEGGAELGRVVFGQGDATVQVRGPGGEVLFRARGERRSPLYGVLLVPNLDPVERYVLMAELLLHEQ